MRNVLERVALTCDGHVVGVEDLRLAQQPHMATVNSEPTATLEQVELQYIRSVLKEENGKVAQAATRLGIPRSTLYQKIKVYGMEIHIN